MGRLAVLTIDDGNFNQGFKVSLQIRRDQGLASVPIRGNLPPDEKIQDLYIGWQKAFDRLINQPNRSNRDEDDWVIDSIPTNISISDMGCNACSCFFTDLENRMKDWLNCSTDRGWQQIRERLTRELSNKSDEIRLMIQANDPLICKLPWHVWDLLNLDPVRDVEIAYSFPGGEPPIMKSPKKNKVRILAVIGHSEGIDVEADLEALKALPDTELNYNKKKLTPQEFITLVGQPPGWDILFFVGHGGTDGETGWIYIDEDQRLRIEQFQYALGKAICSGLKLAIFNSCFGDALTKDLADLHIPVVIVMRQRVPDKVAKSFLKEFLTEYAKGNPLYTSVRRARESLEKFHNLPGATWFPMICQNPTVVPPTWEELRGITPPPPKSKLKTALVASVIVTILLMGMRWLGMLQPWELSALDLLMRLRPYEIPDSRLLVVAITEDDFKLPEQQQRKGSLSDLALGKLLDKLVQGGASVIGLDIYHDYPVDVDPKVPNLAEKQHLVEKLRSEDRFIAICKNRDPSVNNPGNPPPPEIKNISERIGFSDFANESDGILRRQILALNPEPSSPCPAQYAFNTLLALHYLERIDRIKFQPKYTHNKDLQIGKVVFKRLREHMGGYQQVDARDYQILLNYRSSRSDEAVARTVTLTDMLTGKVSPDRLKDKIVLIGVTATSVHDDYFTPYSFGQQYYQKMPGVMVQAQMVSQMISAVLDGRPLLWVWPLWGEVLWVWGWSIVGGVLFTKFTSTRYLLIGGVAALGVLSLGCFGFIWLWGGWVPLIPCAIAFVVTSGTLARIHQKL